MHTSPKFFVTGASGLLGGLVVDALLEMVPASAFIAGVWDTGKDAVAAIRAEGVEVRVADYLRPETLESAFAGVERLLLICSSQNGRRAVQHRNVIDAAKHAGVCLIAYTSILHADTSPLFLAEEDRYTEKIWRHPASRTYCYEQLVQRGLHLAAAAGVEEWHPYGRGGRWTRFGCRTG